MTEQKSKLIEPTHIEENWTIIHLPNGDKLKCKHVVVGVYQVFDDKGNHIHLPDGTPMYGVNFSNPIVGWLPKEDQRKLS